MCPPGSGESFDLYTGDAAAQVRVLAQGLEHRDTASAAAHRLKGAGLTIGAALVSAIAAELEPALAPETVAAPPSGCAR